MLNSRKTLEQGFTLIEAVMVIAITGIIAGMVAMFIRLPVQGYIDSAARAELGDVADPALHYMERDLRLALPNSVRMISAGGNQYIEFLLTKSGGRYLAAEDNPPAGNVLAFTAPDDASKRAFDVVGPMPAGLQAIVKDDFIVVYNLGPGNDPADAYNCTGTGFSVVCNRAQVDANPSGNTITLVNNPFANQPDPKQKSLGHRFHVVTSPVTYVCNPAEHTLTRYWGYAIGATQPTDATAAPLVGASQALLATGITVCGFSYDSGTTDAAGQRNGLVRLSLTMQAQNGDAYTLLHQVHVNNTP